MFSDLNRPREGDLYKRICVAGHSFELRYGYYEDHERTLCPPVVIFPDLTARKLVCPDGYPLVTQVQDVCPYYTADSGVPEQWCGDCLHFDAQDPEIGICRCEHNKQPIQEGMKNEKD